MIEVEKEHNVKNRFAHLNPMIGKVFEALMPQLADRLVGGVVLFTKPGLDEASDFCLAFDRRPASLAPAPVAHLVLLFRLARPQRRVDLTSHAGGVLVQALPSIVAGRGLTVCQVGLLELLNLLRRNRARSGNALPDQE